MKIKYLVVPIVCFMMAFKMPNEFKEPKPTKIPVYGWVSNLNALSDANLKDKLKFYKDKGIDVLMYHGGQDADAYIRIGKFTKELGLGLHAWIPTMVQGKTDKISADWYAVNRNGESALEKPAYVDYYKFLCPSKEGVYQFLETMYDNIAQVKEVDAVHLDYIRFPDVILAKGLWKKYGLVMDKEYAPYDYCYCNDCTGAFKAKTGIDIKKVPDATQVEEWKMFRYNLITNLVNRLAKKIHSRGKKINAAVFPGPGSVAKKIVRQEWNKWDLDTYFPMNYNDFYLEGTDWIGAVTKEAVLAVQGNRPVISGLFICPDPAKKKTEPDPENHGLLPEELEAAIQQSMQNGAKGICLFTPDRMTDEHWKVFEKAIQKNYKTNN